VVKKEAKVEQVKEEEEEIKITEDITSQMITEKKPEVESTEQKV